MRSIWGFLLSLVDFPLKAVLLRDLILHLQPVKTFQTEMSQPVISDKKMQMSFISSVTLSDTRQMFKGCINVWGDLQLVQIVMNLADTLHKLNICLFIWTPLSILQCPRIYKHTLSNTIPS